MDEEPEQFCNNCRRNVGTANFASHSAFCHRNVGICEVCDEPVHKNSIKEHEKKYHITVKCENCNSSVKKWKMPRHEEICPKRLVHCEYCEGDVFANDAEEHIKFCGSRTELCELCAKYIMQKHKKKHLEFHEFEEKFDRRSNASEMHQNMRNECISKTHEKTGCNTGVSLPKSNSEERRTENEVSSRHLKRTYDSSTSQNFFSPSRRVNISSIDHTGIERRPEQRSVAKPGEFLKSDSGSLCHKLKSNILVSEADLLCKHLKDLFNNENCWDAVVQVEDKEFKVHRAILSARSSVFSAMFQHETTEKQTGIVKISDCNADSFKLFLEYLYTGKLVDVSSNSVVHLYTISDKYNVQELKTSCTKYLTQNITIQNISEVVILADQYDEEKLFSAIQDFFNKNVNEIVLTKEWENLLKYNYRLANKLLIGKSKADKGIK